MSKLIVEMEMPKNCEQCPLAERVYSDCENFKLYCLAGEERKEIKTLGIPVWCPIKGVLPDEHGDLVDKETAKNAFDSSFLTFRMKDGETMRGFYQRTIDELPVVIAAERKDDELP